MARSARFLALLTASLISGCGSGDNLDRQSVSGTVTLDSRPLAKGTITFQPVADQATTAASALIIDGTFSIARYEGPVPGSYRVIITSAPLGSGASAKSFGKLEPPPKDPIPAQYNSQSTLNKEIKKGGNDFTFALKGR
jgi:hypothetical protein